MREGAPGAAGPSPPARLPRLGAPLRALAWGAVYYLGGLVGLHTSLPGLPMVLVAPTSGVLIVWFSLSTRSTIGWDLGVLAGAGMLLSHQLGLPAALVPLGPLVSVAQVAAFVGVMRWATTDLAPFGRGQDARRDWRLPDFGAFLVAALCSSTVAAVLNTAAQGAAGLPTGDLEAFLVRWGRSSSTVVALGSVGLLLAPSMAAAWRQRRLRAWVREQVDLGAPRALECLVLCVVSAGSALACFVWLENLPLTFLLFVLTGWVGVRFSPATAALQGLLVGGIAVGATLRGHGMFAVTIADPAQRAAVAQLFVLVVSASGIALAITRRQVAVAERLAEVRAEMLDQVLGAVRDGIAVISADGSVPLMNLASQELLGLAGPVAEVPSARRFEVYDATGGRVEDEATPHRRALAGERVTDEDYEFRPSDGSPPRYLRVSADPLPGDPGRPARVLVGFHDVTSDRLHVDALATFAANVAHDLRGPLSVIEAWNEVLSDAFETGGDVTAAYGAPMTARVARASGRMRDFIQALLDYTLARDRTLALEEVDLVSVARDVAELRSQTGRVEPPVIRVAGSGVALADPVLIRIVIDNLVANACKYVAPGVRPHILITVEDVGVGTVQLCVVDNGIGIPADQRRQVFETFHRVERDGTIEGSGLGLGICHRIVERHAGTIRVDDVTDGTSLRVTLPAGSAVWAGTPRAETPGAGAAPTSSLVDG